MKIGFTLLLAASTLSSQAQQNPSTMPKVATVDPRFQSYNIEMVEVIGGRFWKPYTSSKSTLPDTKSAAPGSIDPGLFEQRTPIDLSNPRLRKLATALGPAYLRVSGTWANTLYFHNSDAPAPAAPPEGFGGVLTRPQWKGVVDFSKAVNAELVTSFSASAGTRNASHSDKTETIKVRCSPAEADLIRGLIAERQLMDPQSLKLTSADILTQALEEYMAGRRLQRNKPVAPLNSANGRELE